jgi:RNA polymerase sigma-70 factor (ECF subfamily)
MTTLPLPQDAALGALGSPWYKAKRGMSERAPDADIREAFLAEEPEALEQVRAWVRGLVLGAWQFPDPEAVVQDIVVELLGLSRQGRVRRSTHFKSFVLTVARHTCIDHYRRRRLRDAVDAEVATPEDRPSDGPSVEEAVIARQKRRMARYVLQSLDEDCRELLALVFGQDLQAREAGERLGLSEANVRVRTHRCLKRARALRARFWGD